MSLRLPTALVRLAWRGGETLGTGDLGRADRDEEGEREPREGEQGVPADGGGPARDAGDLEEGEGPPRGVLQQEGGPDAEQAGPSARRGRGGHARWFRGVQEVWGRGRYGAH